MLVSENSTSYGKDLGDLRSLEKLLPQLAAVEGIARVRVAYLQPAELRPGPARGHRRAPTGIAPYFDLSFQHSSPTLLRRMRRFGGTDDFLALIERARALAPGAGFRTNVILGFPGETEDDVAELERFLTEGRLDAVGVFGYSDEEGTEAIGPARQARPGRDRRPRPADHRPGRGAHRPARRGPDRRAGRGAAHRGPLGRVRGRRDAGLGHAAHQDPDADGTTTVAGVPADARRRASCVDRRRSSTPRASTCIARVLAAALARPLRPGGERRGADVAADPAATPPQSAKLVNLPNALTVLRLAVVPVFAVLLLPTAAWTTAGGTGPRWSSPARSSPTATTA